MQTQPKSKPGILGIMLLRLLIQRLLVPTLVLILLSRRHFTRTPTLTQ